MDNREIGLELIRIIKDYAQPAFLSCCNSTRLCGSIMDYQDSLSAHISCVKQLFIWKRSIGGLTTADGIQLNELLEALFTLNDVPNEAILEGFSLSISTGGLPEPTLFISSFIKMLSTLKASDLIGRDEYIKAVESISNIINILSMKGYQGEILRHVIDHILNVDNVSPLLTLVIPEFSPSLLSSLEMGFSEVLRCLIALLFWPQTEAVTSWVEPILKLFYNYLSEVEHRQKINSFLNIAESLVFSMIKVLNISPLLFGTLKTLEILLIVLNSPRTFHQLLPSLIKTTSAYINAELEEGSPRSESKVNTIYAFETIKDANEPSIALISINKDDALRRISDFIYSQMILFTGYSEIYQPVLKYLTNNSLAPNHEELSNRLQHVVEVHQKLYAHKKLSILQTSYAYGKTPSTFKDKVMKEHNVCGLVNIGNTCYLNSFLQVLYMTSSFRQFILNWNGPTFINNLRHTFASLQLTDKGSIPPTLIYKSLPDYFREGRQQDASELGKIIFNLIEESAKSDSKSNPISEFFGGKLSTKTVCSVCNNASVREEEYYDLSLSFPTKSASVSLSEMIEFFTEPEVLNEDNQYKCDRCNKLVDASKKTTLVSAPKHLVLTFQRFSFDYVTKTRSKILTPVSFSERMELPIEHGDGIEMVKYILYGVIMHAGRSTEYGHYYSYARSTYNIEEAGGPLWLKFNDEYVTTSSFDSFVNISKSFPSDVVYMLFYVKSGCNSMESSPYIPDDLSHLVNEENKKFLKETGRLGRSDKHFSNVWDDHSV